ncbi:DNA cytosine methyltransferase [Sinorhizobium medicae]|nr:DNA cytosine methyltransferase [Sinorhizobium medicae]
MAAYYNEFDKKAAQWLRNLISAGLIAPGDVDDRSILDVSPDDLRGYTQCHFFAGIGVWSHALRRAGWPDDRPVWTGSCPCQPFSAAGGGTGFADERHLWPAWHHLIRVQRPPVLFGEQVASKDGLGWLDLVQADLEGEDYACWPVDLCAAGVGAPHIRQRLWFIGERLADACDLGLQGRIHRRPDTQWQIEHGSLGRLRPAIRLANPDRFTGAQGRAIDSWGHQGSDAGPRSRSGSRSSIVRLANADGRDTGTERKQRGWQQRLLEEDRSLIGAPDQGPWLGSAGQSPHEAHDGWGTVDWLFCQDGKWRPVEPGTLPLAHGATARVVRLRAYGNAINAEAATQVIGAFLDHEALEPQALGARSDLAQLDDLI